ncbi:MAG TPA: nuclear transport factor 2 family protein [Candidatus Limnocylindria bacterium]
MTDTVHERVMNGMADVVSTHDWARLGEYFHADAVLEFPQSGERFRGVANIRAQFAGYPALESGTSRLEEVIGETIAYALTRSYTVIDIEGTGNRGTAIIRVRYPDGSLWYALNVYELRDGRIDRCRTYFAPDFDPPAWREPFREAP